MLEIFPDLLRSATSDLCVLLLLFSLARPKYGKVRTILPLLLIMVLDIILNSFSYRTGDYAQAIRFSVFITVPMLFLAKPLFQESFMQWCFNVVTAMNVFAIVQFLAFHLSKLTPIPMYGITLVRILLFAIIIFLFYRFLRPIYQKAIHYWRSFLLAAISILACFYYVLESGEDIVYILNARAGLLTLLSIMTVCVYTSFFLSLYLISQEYELHEENLQMKTNEDLMRSSVQAMENRLHLLESADKKASILRHDRRHLDATLLTMMQEGNTSKAMTVLEQQLQVPVVHPTKYCENQVVNAIVSYHIALAKKDDISCNISLDIPEQCEIDSLKLAVTISNLLENSIHGCISLPQSQRFIRFTATCVGQLLIGIENSCSEDCLLDEEGYPINKQGQRGIGTTSILAFVTLYDGEIDYEIKNNVFRVQMIL